jgi:hypothetical protein
MMICALNIDVSIGAIRGAFNPLSCLIEVHDYQKQIRFHVLAPDQQRVLSSLSIALRDVVDPYTLHAQLQEARARIKRKGFRLKSWTIPSWAANIPPAIRQI